MKVRLSGMVIRRRTRRREVRREMVSVWEGDGRDGDLEVHGGGVGNWGAMEWGRVDMSGPNCIRGDGVGD